MDGFFRRATHVGGGGIRCKCCMPKSGNKYGAAARTLIKRQAKRLLARTVDKLNKDMT
jgi:hypothetical protein